jgi:hypothetical protein
LDETHDVQRAFEAAEEAYQLEPHGPERELGAGRWRPAEPNGGRV